MIKFTHNIFVKGLNIAPFAVLQHFDALFSWVSYVKFLLLQISLSAIIKSLM